MSRFSFRKDFNYDLALLTEVHSLNPFSETSKKKTNLIWEEVAKNLKDGDLQMQVTTRNCKQRTMDLMKEFRANEALSVKSTGVAESEMDKVKDLLTNIVKLQEDSRSGALKRLYSKKARTEAEMIRSSAIETLAASGASGDESLSPDEDSEDTQLMTKDKDNAAGIEVAEEDPMGFEPSTTKKMKRGKKVQPELAMVEYLKTKNKNDVELKRKELEVRDREAENRAVELQMARERQAAEMEERKQMTNILFSLVQKK